MNNLNTSRNRMENEIDPSGGGTLKIALGFCALGVVAAVMLVPMMNSETASKMQFAATNGQSGSSVDQITTGAVSKDKRKLRYTVTRSVLQRDPSKPCITYEDGTQEGGC